MADSRPGRVLFAAALVSAVMGSVHAFSVFLTPLEARFDAGRAPVSFAYALALVFLTVAVLLGPRLYERMSAARLMVLACALGAIGAGVAGMAPTLAGLWAGYSLLFGLANGLAYGFGLQLAAKAYPGREGLAMGAVTGAYAFGAIAAPYLFEAAVRTGGFEAAMAGLAAALLVAGGCAAWLMGGARFRSGPAVVSAGRRRRPILARLGLGYFGAVLAGLSIIGHAAAIHATGRPEAAVWIAPAVVAAFNLCGSLIGGRMMDLIAPRRVLAALALLTALACTGLAVATGGTVALVLLGLVGFAYGATIAAYPAAIAKAFGMGASAQVYGRVFTAWGTAGLAGPWLAGLIFDATGGYDVTLWIAAAGALLSALVISHNVALSRGGP